MIDTPSITQATLQPAAVIHLTMPRAEIEAVMHPAIGELFAEIAAQGIAPAGPLFSYHLRMDSAFFDLEIGIPVATPVTPTGRVKPGSLPAARVLRTIYRGPYEGLAGAWGEFGNWIKANGHKVGPTLWESYVKGPESSDAPADWQTELNRSVIA